MSKKKNPILVWFKTTAEIWGYWQFLKTIGLSLAGASAMILAIRQWFIGLDTSGHILVAIFLLGLILVAIAFVREWQMRRSVNYIPKLLLMMDDKMKYLIELAKFPPDEPLTKACLDLAEIFNIDMDTISETVKLGKKVEIRKMFRNAAPLNRPNPVPLNSLHILYEALSYIQGILNHYEIGIEAIKDTQYRKLEERFEALRYRLQLIPRGADTIKQLTKYSLWWEAYSSFLLFLHYDLKSSIPSDVLPVQGRALLPNLQKQVVGIIANLRADVLKSMQSSK